MFQLSSSAVRCGLWIRGFRNVDIGKLAEFLLVIRMYSFLFAVYACAHDYWHTKPFVIKEGNPAGPGTP